MTDRNEPLELMDEMENLHDFDVGQGFPLPLRYCSDWQALRTTLKAQRDKMAQKDESYIWLESKHHSRMLENEALRARIARLESGAVLAIQSLRDRWQAGGTALLVASGLQSIVAESPRQSAAALKVEVLREFADSFGELSAADASGGLGHAISMAREEADRIEREAKERSE